MQFNSLAEFNEWLEAGLHAIVNGDKKTMNETETRIYNVVKDNLGEHLTLNENVPPEVGCAECGSKILQLAGIPVPTHGIAGTAAFVAWFVASSDFEEIFEPEQGAFVVFATGSGNGKFPGHMGVFCAFNLMYISDWAVASNDSNTGTLREQWAWKKMLEYYQEVGGMKPRIFRPL